MVKTLPILIIALLAFTPLAMAEPSKAPLNISADGTLEWNRTDKTFVARDKALASQDGVSITAEKLTAEYRENTTTGNDFEIHTMTADGNVVIISDKNKAYGDQAVYNLDKKLAIMTGANLRLITPQQTITARDKFEYHVADGKLVAIGAAKIIRPTDTLEADTITAILTTNDKGQRTLDQMVANGNVVVTTATEKVTGNYGTYNARTEQAEITGGVTITRGPNILQGERATVDMKTQVSRIFGNKTGNKRVTGTFYPGSEALEQKKEQ